MISVLLAGLIAGMITLISCVSFAALIFNGVLSPFIASGITILVSTAIVAGVVFSLWSAARPVVALPDDDTAPVLALMVTLIIAGVPEGTPPEILFVSSFGALACAALLTGIVLTALGYFRLGSLVRYLPYSVMGGYFAGAGWLLIQGALRVVSDLPLASSQDFLALVDADIVWRWLPAIGVAFCIRWAVRHWHRSVAMPASMVLLVSAFFAVAALCWLRVVVLQLRMRTLAREAVAAGTALPAQFGRCLRQWVVLGFVALFCFLGIFYFMVFRPVR